MSNSVYIFRNLLYWRAPYIIQERRGHRKMNYNDIAWNFHIANDDESVFLFLAPNIWLLVWRFDTKTQTHSAGGGGCTNRHVHVKDTERRPSSLASPSSLSTRWSRMERRTAEPCHIHVEATYTLYSKILEYRGWKLTSTSCRRCVVVDCQRQGWNVLHLICDHWLIFRPSTVRSFKSRQASRYLLRCLLHWQWICFED